MRNKTFFIIFTAIVLSAVLSCASCVKKSIDGKNEAETKTETASGISADVKDDTKDAEGSFCLLVYMIGSDLENFDGAASNDIQEMLEAASGDNLNIVIQTGGSKSWHLKEIENDGVGRYRIKDGKLETIELLDDVKMSEAETLADFITWAGKCYPADRYGMVLWNHGGGTLIGYGLDEYYPDETMSIGEIHEALSKSGLHFDFIGFDACLMCTVETAVALSGHADYMMASEETEPSTGWYYTEWIKKISDDPGMSIPELAGTIIDSFVSGPDYNKYDFYTLSLIDLKKTGDLYLALGEYFKEEEAIFNEQFRNALTARTHTKSFGNDGYEQIDLFDYLESSEEETQSGRAQKVLEKAREAVCYYRGTVAGSNGIAIYYPYLYPKKFDQVMEMLYSLDYDESYFDFYRHFLNVLVKTGLNVSETGGGEEKSVSSVKKIKDITVDMKISEEDLLKTSWYDPDTVIPEDLLVPDVNFFKLIKKGKPGLRLPEEQRELITDIWVDYWLDTGDGWLLDYGTWNLSDWDRAGDNTLDHDWDRDGDITRGHDWNRNGDIIPDYDGKWLALNGEIVPYYLTGVVHGETSGEDYICGYVPAMLKDKNILIQIVQDAETPDGRIVGYKYNYRNAVSRFDEDPKISPKGLHQFKDGDEIRPCYARYTNGDSIGTNTFDSLVYSENPIIYSEGIEVSYESFHRTGGKDHVLMNFRLNDIYGNTYYTSAVEAPDTGASDENSETGTPAALSGGRANSAGSQPAAPGVYNALMQSNGNITMNNDDAANTADEPVNVTPTENTDEQTNLAPTDNDGEQDNANVIDNADEQNEEDEVEADEQNEEVDADEQNDADEVDADELNNEVQDAGDNNAANNEVQDAGDNNSVGTETNAGADNASNTRAAAGNNEQTYSTQESGEYLLNENQDVGTVNNDSGI
ncbi:hypothetical protein SAMN05216349_11119 [Oribacterium sp. KHPX15]|uniref:clostripain-related cysteine peptidase n=1 Tax=Oribacterium sp. KHPX15 TaxID=1855342 RepID=UPI00089A49DC|nr:clostripain-related cysteine peptidase [Oribacterium sp. KHPX15]SEA38834.1 hypothetical protein SAMN05216349_11119 [Oribacterium sp. KHPX15]